MWQVRLGGVVQQPANVTVPSTPMMLDSHRKGRLVRWTTAAGLFLGTLLLVGLTSKDYGVAWDEPPYFHAADLHVGWIADFGKHLVQGKIEHSLSDENITAAWHWDPYHVPHPPFSRIISGLTRSLASPWLDKFSAYRLGPALFFATLVTFMFLWMSELFGRATALFSSLALILMPNLFGFAHIAVTDVPLASLWFLTAYCFWKGLDKWQWSVACGGVWGLALATKFPAVFIPIPLILWAHLFHRTQYANNIFAIVFLGPLVTIASQPYLWHQSGMRLLEFLYQGLSRGYRLDTNFTIYFFGQLYYTDQLPWYYPFFLVAVTTPEPILALAAIGILSMPTVREHTSALALFVSEAVFVLGLGLLPGAVLHDGLRQLLSALPFVVALAGVGFFVITRRLWALAAGWTRLQAVAHLRAKLLAALSAVFLFPPLLDLYLCHPFQLSFYNRLIGGIRGAYARGLEVTYAMEAFSPPFLKALNEKLPQNSAINASFANFMFVYYQAEGRLRSDIKITDTGYFNYYVLLNRRSVLHPRERFLMNGTGPPYLSQGVAGVPLVSVFEVKKPSGY
jgi:hypothetical protein